MERSANPSVDPCLELRGEFAPACPVCSGPMVELRGMSRCARCYFVVCLSCEGEAYHPPTDYAGA